ncbi:MAG TPA: class I SAM-dependent methyltransferase [Streptosporangiaceae bacterium]|nr:class I SAM-dependent methyltransferase [Streptosporangiaceae bacterium]
MAQCQPEQGQPEQGRPEQCQPEQCQPDLASNPDRLRWNKRYSEDFRSSFEAHPLAIRALSMQLPAGPVLDLACGPSGSALYAAEQGRMVTAVDASDVALGMLAAQAARRELSQLVLVVHADLHAWLPPCAAYAVVLCTGFWDSDVFAGASTAVRPGGILAWEAFTRVAQVDRPSLPVQWCVGPGEPASLLPPGFDVISQEDAPGSSGAKRQLMAKRRPG